MNSLLYILKEALTELADSNKSFHFNQKSDLTVMDSSNVYLSGTKVYNFTTDNDFKYIIKILYLSSSDSMYEYADEGDGQMVEIEFDIDNPDSNAPDHAVTNNIKELYAVMATISNVIKDSYKKDNFKYIIHLSSNTKNKGRSLKGSEQRDKLYQYYIRKEFPKSDSKTVDHYMMTTLK